MKRSLNDSEEETRKEDDYLQSFDSFVYRFDRLHQYGVDVCMIIHILCFLAYMLRIVNLDMMFRFT